MPNNFTPDAQQRLAAIHKLSQEINASSGPHADKLLAMMQHHVEEITELAQKNDPHATVETGDLLVLCWELIMELSGDPDAVLSQCLSRFEKKLSELRPDI